MMRKARVVAVYPSQGTCDLVMLDTGVPLAQVEVQGKSSNYGCSWRTPDVPKPSTNVRGASVEPGMQNLVAYVDFVGRMPVVTGFSRPADGLMPTEQNRWLDVHDATGTYHTVAPDGSYEVFVPGGGVLRIGTGGHQDLSSVITRGKLPANGPGQVTVTLATAAGTLTCSPAGVWSLTGATLNIGCDTTINGNLHVTGTGTFDTDAIIAGKSFNQHKHGGVQQGSNDSSIPV